MWIKKDPKLVETYLYILHTLQKLHEHLIYSTLYTARCMSLSCRNLKRSLQKCILCDDMLLLAGPIIVKSPVLLH